MNLTFRCYCLKDLIWKEEHKNFQQSFTPTPKGSLLQILSTEVKKIEFTPFSVGENEFDFRCCYLNGLIWKEEHKNFQQSFTPTPKGRLMEILSKGVEKIKFTPFSVGENEFDFRRICLKI